LSYPAPAPARAHHNERLRKTRRRENMQNGACNGCSFCEVIASSLIDTETRESRPRPLSLYLDGVIFRLAKEPPCPGPTHSPTPPPLRSLNSSTTRLGSLLSLTYTLTLGFLTTIWTWNHASPSGAGTIGFSYCPGLSLRSTCQRYFG